MLARGLPASTLTIRASDVACGPRAGRAGLRGPLAYKLLLSFPGTVPTHSGAQGKTAHRKQRSKHSLSGCRSRQRCSAGGVKRYWPPSPCSS
jgi:hypothetical protein